MVDDTGGRSRQQHGTDTSDDSKAPLQAPESRIGAPAEGSTEREETRAEANAPQKGGYVAFEARISGIWRSFNDNAGVWTALATIVMALTMIVYTIYQGRLWREMRSSGGDTHHLASAAKEQAAAAKAQSGQAEAQTTKMAESLRKTDELIRQATEQAKATNKLAGEAKKSAEVAKESLDEIRANFVRDQRPWLSVAGMELPAEPKEGEDFSIYVTLINSGRTPALTVIPQCKVFVWETGRGVNELAGAMELEPPFTSFPIPPEKALSTMSVSPGMTGRRFNSPPAKLDKDRLVSYGAKKSVLLFHALILYKDVFSPGHWHWTTLCAYHVNGKAPGEFSFCANNNDMDHEEQASQEGQQPRRPN